MNKCTIIFTRSRDGEIEMFRQVERAIAQEGIDWESSTRTFAKRLHNTLNCLGVNERLVLNIEVQPVPMR